MKDTIKNEMSKEPFASCSFSSASSSTKEDEGVPMMELHDVIKEKEEVGYFFLKDAMVTLICCSSSSSSLQEQHKLPVHATYKGMAEEKEEKNHTKCTSSNDDHCEDDSIDVHNVMKCIKNGLISDEWLDIHFKDDMKAEGKECKKIKQGIAKNHNDEGNDSDDDDINDTFSNNCVDTQLCPRCNVVLRYETNALHYPSISKRHYFSGLINDVKLCKTCSSSVPQKRHQQSQRSDASILLGMILNCKDEGFVRIQKFQILMHGSIIEQVDNSSTNNEEQTKENEEEPSQKIYLVKCSLVLTISLPYLEKISQSSLNEHHTRTASNSHVGHYDECLSTNSAQFPVYGQLFFSVMRCDWSWLDQIMKHLQFINKKRIESQYKPSMKNNQIYHQQEDDNVHELTSMFPSHLSLEELYLRIQGASFHDMASYNSISVKQGINDNRDTMNSIIYLPMDAIKCNIAPFLRARSLNNLRTTCKYMYNVLRAVVPGMKLTLYPHQVQSLQWMRKRESSCMTEDDSIQFGADNNAIDSALHGDLFRSVTAGTIIAVTPRREKSHSETGKKASPFWHINTWNGDCSLNYRKERIRTVAKCRNVARGGLLCDDPGLGKTITILSLILQTFGQSTELSDHNKKSQTHISEELIVESYWKESLVSYTRRDELNSLCMQLRKLDLQQYFQFPVNELLDEEDFERYSSIIKNPTCLDHVMTKIKNDVYDNSLSAFQEDIRQIYQNTMKYYSCEDIIYQRAQYILNESQSLLDKFQQRQLTAAFSVSQKRSKLSLSALVAESRRIQVLDTLIPSMGTLLIVPHTLVSHWKVSKDSLFMIVFFAVHGIHTNLIPGKGANYCTCIVFSLFEEKTFNISPQNN